MQPKKSFIIVLIILLFLVIGGPVWWFSARRNVVPLEPQAGTNTDTRLWNTYRNEEYGFTLKYPPGWQVVEFPNDPNGPIFNIYQPLSYSAPIPPELEPPLTHQRGGKNVSVYPKGIPTEGFFGETATSSVEIHEAAEQTREFILADGTPWGVLVAGFKEPPPSWGEAGFVWARAGIEHEKEECFRGSTKLESDSCDPFAGERLVRQGSVDQNDWAVIRGILDSFTFTIHGTNARDLIRVDAPVSGSKIESPLVVKGEARGLWYFEASFPMTLTDWDGRIIAQGISTARGEWMTEDFVPFEGELTFEKPPSGSRGALILNRDNPSGLPEHDASVEIPVEF